MFANVACAVVKFQALTRTGEHMWISISTVPTAVKGSAFRFLCRKLAGFTAVSATLCGEKTHTLTHARARTDPVLL